MLHVAAAIAWPTYPHFKLGPLSISPHGIGIAVGFILGARLMLPEAERKGIGENEVYPLLTRAAIGAIVGARIAFVINHLAASSTDVGYIHDPLAIFKIWEGGISLLGGFIGAIAVALPEMRKRRLSFWQVMDAAAPGMALGVIIGRVGDLIVGDHLGKQTGFFLGFKCPNKVTSTASPCLPGPGAVVHQTALYDFVLSIILLAMLLWLRQRRGRYDGYLITVFGAWYGCQRILEDFLREDKHVVPGLTGSQVTAILTVLVCLWHLIFVRRTPRWGRWDERAGPPGDDEGDEGEEGDEADEGDVGYEGVEPEGAGAVGVPSTSDAPAPEDMAPAPTSVDGEPRTEE